MLAEAVEQIISLLDKIWNRLATHCLCIVLANAHIRRNMTMLHFGTFT